MLDLETNSVYELPVELYAAMDNAYDNFDAVVKDSKNPHFKNTFASLSSFQEATAAGLKANNLSIKYIAQGDTMVLRVVHLPSGQHQDYFAPMFGDGAQQWGGSATYMRRYLFQIAFNISPEDDDGNAATGKPLAAEAIPKKVVDTGKRRML